MEFFHQRGDSGPQSSVPREFMGPRKKRIRQLNLPALTPVRSLLHPFLTDADAARLMRVSHTTATQLLQGYTFTQHVFEPVNAEAMRRTKALYEAYDMRPTRMRLSEDVKEVALEEGSARSPFPSSLTYLLLGSARRDGHDSSHPRTSMFGSEGGRVDSIQCLWIHPGSKSEDEWYQQLLQPPQFERPVFYLRVSRTLLNFSLPRGLLPYGLRYLQLPQRFNSPLQVGSIPSTVEVLQFGWNFNHSLSAGLLPSSLVHLVLHCPFNYPLAPGVLPASLQRLYMSKWNHPLAGGVLPSSLQALVLMNFNHPIDPGVLPSGLTHLRFNHFNSPLSVGSLPSSLISLHLGFAFVHPLLPHVLPSSLRVLHLCRGNHPPLTRGILPEGLVVLHYCFQRVELEFLSDVLPSSVRVLDLLGYYGGHIPAGAIPGTVRWLQLPMDYRERVAELQLSAETQVEWAEWDE